MKLVIFGLTISSSWGNGHATLWRALLRAFARRGHDVVFFERDVPYYAAHRDLRELDFGQLRLYADWASIRAGAARELEDADAGMVTSYCPDGIAASELVLDSNAARRVFYDLDTPVTLSQLSAGERVPYLPPQGLGDFDLVLSYTGGEASIRTSIVPWRPSRHTDPISRISARTPRTGSARSRSSFSSRRADSHPCAF
jgi:spore maturation protein CgeB